MSSTISPALPSDDTISARLAERMAEIAEQVRRLAPPEGYDPGLFRVEMGDLASEIAAIGDEAARRLTKPS